MNSPCQRGDFFCTMQYCSGFLTNAVGNELAAIWDNTDCVGAFSVNLNTKNLKVVYNPDSLPTVQNSAQYLFENFFKTNDITDDVASPRYSNFQNKILQLCTSTSLPGVCDGYLKNYCSRYTREQVSNSPSLTDFCGCYAPPDPDYLKLTLGSPGCQIGTGCTAGCREGESGCTGQPACDPLCHRALTVQKSYQPSGNLITCPQQICVIDDAVINVENSYIQGGINFNSVCGGCSATGSAGCLCIVSGQNISNTFAKIGVGSQINQFCGDASVCLVEDAQGNVISQGACRNVDPSEVSYDTYYRPTVGILILIGLVVLIVFFVVVSMRYSSSALYVPR